MVALQRLYHVHVLASLLLYSSTLLAAQQSINNYNSTANLSSSWINRPSFLINGSMIGSSFSTVTPILFRGSNGSSFICGFLCNALGHQDSEDCIFGVLIFQYKYSYDDFLKIVIQSPQLVWSVNRNNPVQIGAELRFKQDGDLVLANSDGTLVWSSNTTGKSVAGMNLTENGNIVLFGRNSEPIWQSFDHPTDSLVLGQKLSRGQKLTASVSASNWSEGLFYFSNDIDGLAAYVKSNPPQRYYFSEVFREIAHNVEFYNGQFDNYYFPSASAAQFMKFGPDGHLKVYQWGGSQWMEVADLLTGYRGDCGYPLVCGNYGVCSKGQCTCLETINGQGNFFKQVQPWQPNLGCFLVTPISCAPSQDHSLLELENTYYFAFQSYEEKTLVEDCKNSCLSDCSCKAALFTKDPSNSSSRRGNFNSSSRRGTFNSSSRRGSCLLLNEVFSIANNENHVASYYNTTLFVKVQNPNAKASSLRSKILVPVSTLAAFFVVLCVTGSCLVLFRKRNKQSNETEEDFLKHVPGMPTRYSYGNLKAATEDFGKKLGEGGFGSVYEGRLSDGTKIAVKCLDGLGKVKDSFLVEVKAIGSIHHVNLVRLIGYCFEKSHRLLVYEYMAKRSLDGWIFGGEKSYNLPWHTRRKIIFDIAKGLAYLHEECCQKIIHLDIKPQNILLDQNFNAKISDFGLSKLIEKDQSRVVTTMRGTPGYLAPEWLSSVITEKVDVYSFGVVMLEIICGRKNLDWSRSEEDRHLLSIYKRKAEEGKLEEMVDEKNENVLNHIEEAVEMMGIAAWCLQGDFTRRPSMSMVVKVLEGSAAAETNLDYDFLNPRIVTKGAAGDSRPDAFNDTTKLLASTLSGPR